MKLILLEDNHKDGDIFCQQLESLTGYTLEDFIARYDLIHSNEYVSNFSIGKWLLEIPSSNPVWHLWQED